MARLSISQAIGSNSVIATSGTFGSLTASSGNPVLAIPLSDLAGYLDTPTTELARWIGGILLKYRASLVADATEDNAIAISDALKQFVTRDNQQAIGYAYDVTFFVPDTSPASFDPDTTLPDA